MLELNTLNLYPVYDVPAPSRRKMSINSSASAMGDLSSAIAQHGAPDARGGVPVEFERAMENIASYNTTSNGYENPFIDIGGKGQRVQYNGKSNIYNFVAILTIKKINSTSSYEDRVIISGYTSEAKPSFNGLIGDDTLFHINDVYGLRVTYTTNALGQRVVAENGLSIISNHVLASALPAEGMMLGESYVLPDSMITVALDRIDYDLPETLGTGDNQVLFADTFKLKSQAVDSNLVNPEQFVSAAASGLLSGIQSASELGETKSYFNNAGTETSRYFASKRQITSAGNLAFIRTLRDTLSSASLISDSEDLSTKGSFSLGNLRVAVPNNSRQLDEFIKGSIQMGQNTMNAGAHTDSWQSNSPAGIVAYDIAIRMGRIMARNTITSCSVVISNVDYTQFSNRQVFIVPKSISTIDKSGYLPMILKDRFEKSLDLDILTPVSKHDSIPFRATVHTTLGGVCRVEIEMSGAPRKEEYTFASFMSGRINTSTTTDNGYVNQLTKNLGALASSVRSGHNQYTNNAASSQIFQSDDDAPQQAPMFGGQSSQSYKW